MAEAGHLGALVASITAVHRFLAVAGASDAEGQVEHQQCCALCGMLDGCKVSLTEQATLVELLNEGPWSEASMKMLILRLMQAAGTANKPPEETASPAAAVGVERGGIQHGGKRSTQVLLHFHEFVTDSWVSTFQAKERDGMPGSSLKFLQDSLVDLGVTNLSERSAQAMAAYHLYLAKGYAGAMQVPVPERLRLVELLKDIKNVPASRQRLFMQYPNNAAHFKERHPEIYAKVFGEGAPAGFRPPLNALEYHTLAPHNM